MESNVTSMTPAQMRAIRMQRQLAWLQVVWEVMTVDERKGQ